jgi:hypothetical protein
MTHHPLDRQSGRALAALSAAICVPIRRIGFLIMPLIWWTRRQFARRGRMAEYCDEIKIRKSISLARVAKTQRDALGFGCNGS